MCWEKTIEEVEKGWLSNPRPLGAVTGNTVPLTPRFLIPEQHGEGEAKTRLIGDFSVSGLNSLLATVDTNIPDNLDVLLAVSTYYKLIAPGADLRATVFDYKGAYKNIPICREQLDFASILIAPPTGELQVCQLRVLPFGPRRSPANWARMAGFIQWVAMNVAKLFLAVFVDDCYTVEPCSTIDSAFVVLNAINAAVGLPLAPDKGSEPTENLCLLGAQITFASDFVEAALPRRKAVDLIHDLRPVLQRGSLSPAQAAKLRGRLGWAQSLFFGRFGRARLAPFSARQYASISGKARLPTELAEVIPWWMAHLDAPAPRRIYFANTKPTVVYTDACGSGQLGATIHIERQRHVFDTHAPRWFNEETGIFEKEQAGAILGLLAAILLAPGAPVLLICDNSGACATVVRGSSKTVLGRRLASVFWSIAASCGVAVWVEQVASALNDADAPSRFCPLSEDPKTRSAGSQGPPLDFRKIFPTKASLLEAQYKFKQGVADFGSPFPCDFANNEPGLNKAETNGADCPRLNT